jgi:hypothetical protein
MSDKDVIETYTDDARHLATDQRDLCFELNGLASPKSGPVFASSLPRKRSGKYRRLGPNRVKPNIDPVMSLLHMGKIVVQDDTARLNHDHTVGNLLNFRQ